MRSRRTNLLQSKMSTIFATHRPACAAALVLCAFAVIGASRHARGQAGDGAVIEPSPHVATRIRWIQFHMVAGRVVAASPMVVPRMIVPPSTSQRNGQREQLSIEINAGLANMQYDASNAASRLQVVISNSNQITIQHNQQDAFAFEFRQQPEQPLTMTLDAQGQKRTWKADGFWQLFLSEPEVVRRHLIPVLELLRPTWQLAAVGAQLEEALLSRTADNAQPDREHWSQLVADLASPQFPAREAAQRELYRTGQAIVPFLQNLDRSRLDAEQAYRVRWLVDNLSVDYEDKVDRTASWLAGDEQVWLALLARPDAAKRRVSAEQLARLTGHPLDFDPDAPDMTRQAQLEKLRERLEKPSLKVH